MIAQCTSRWANSRIFLVLQLAGLALLAVGCGGGGGYQQASARPVTGANAATLQVTRNSQVCAAGCATAVLVNGVRLGTINNAETKQFSFAVLPAGNKLVLQHTELWSDGRTKAEHHFNLKAGELYSVSFHYEPGPPLSIALAAASANTPFYGMSIELDPTVLYEEAESEVVQAVMGVVQRIRRSRLIEHSVDHSQAGSIGLALGGNAAAFSAEVRGQIETKLGQQFKQAETIEREVQIDGGSTRYRLTWVYRIRSGRATYRSGLTDQSIPFKFRESAELKVTSISN